MANGKDRGKVWIAVAGLVAAEDGSWLLVKKKYGGLKGMWSIPAGFINAGETADAAVKREVLEETGVECAVKGLIGLRTGVIKNEISDNMLIFLLEALPGQIIRVQQEELFDVQYIQPADIVDRDDASVMLKYLLNQALNARGNIINDINPGGQFGYTEYKLIL